MLFGWLPAASGQFWCAGMGGQTGRSADGNWPVCAKTAEITFQLTFPDAPGNRQPP
jgi:hypothetical protein